MIPLAPLSLFIVVPLFFLPTWYMILLMIPTLWLVLGRVMCIMAFNPSHREVMLDFFSQIEEITKKVNKVNSTLTVKIFNN